MLDGCMGQRFRFYSFEVFKKSLESTTNIRIILISNKLITKHLYMSHLRIL